MLNLEPKALIYKYSCFRVSFRFQNPSIVIHTDLRHVNKTYLNVYDGPAQLTNLPHEIHASMQPKATDCFE